MRSTEPSRHLPPTRDPASGVRAIPRRWPWVCLCVLLVGVATAGGQVVPGTGAHQPFDEILDLYVRDGNVYYRALKQERARFDRYVESLAISSATYASWSRDEQTAYWINAYNALVLRTVIDHYPIRGRSGEYPAGSIRQVAGAFDRQIHRAAGRMVSLDDIEQTVVSELGDPRVLFTLGRGAVGSPRLRSEVYTASRLEAQLAAATAELARTPRHVDVDIIAGEIAVSPIVGWHEDSFTASFGRDESRYPRRSPIERAIFVLMEPHLLPQEREFVAEDRFTVRYHTFDWRLNDLTDGAPR